jgi:hypothetical protein
MSTGKGPWALAEQTLPIWAFLYAAENDKKVSTTHQIFYLQ